MLVLIFEIYRRSKLSASNNVPLGTFAAYQSPEKLEESRRRTKIQMIMFIQEVSCEEDRKWKIDENLH